MVMPHGAVPSQPLGQLRARGPPGLYSVRGAALWRPLVRVNANSPTACDERLCLPSGVLMNFTLLAQPTAHTSFIAGARRWHVARWLSADQVTSGSAAQWHEDTAAALAHRGMRR